MLTEKTIYENVREFSRLHQGKRTFNTVTPSQWGQIRAIAANSKDIKELQDTLFREVKAQQSDGILRSHELTLSGYLRHGKTAEKWKKCTKILENEIENKKAFGPRYLVCLATQMQKESRMPDRKGISK